MQEPSSYKAAGCVRAEAITPERRCTPGRGGSALQLFVYFLTRLR